MAKAAKKVQKKVQKKRAATYEKPVTFDDTFEDMINISLTGAGSKKAKINTKKYLNFCFKK